MRNGEGSVAWSPVGGVKAMVTVSESVSENTEIVVKNSGELEQIILDTHILLVAESGIKVQIH